MGATRHPGRDPKPVHQPAACQVATEGQDYCVIVIQTDQLASITIAQGFIN